MKENDIKTHVVAVIAIIKKGNKFLLAKRSSSDPQAGGEWSFPGGKVDHQIGRNVLEETLKREVQEEVGLQIHNQMEIIFHDAFIRVSGHHVIMITYLCYWKSGVARSLDDQEEIQWLTAKDILNMKGIPNYTLERFIALINYLKSKSIVF